MTREFAADAERAAFRALNSVVEPAVRRGIGNSALGPGVFLVETRGRRTGRVRKVPLMGERYVGRVVVRTVRPHSQWVRNLEAEGGAHVWIGGRRRPATATIRRYGSVAVATLRLDAEQDASDVG
jgi:deazaflavin-dependent oxidoreductase (nitroreductase family)